MRTLKEVLGGYSPKSPDERRFVAKHKVKKHDDVAGNDDKLYKASNIKAVDRESPENHGYNPGSDEAVYEGYKGTITRDSRIKGQMKRDDIRIDAAERKVKQGPNPAKELRKYQRWRADNFDDRQTTRDIISRPHAFREDKKKPFAKLLADKPKDSDSQPALNSAEPTKKGAAAFKGPNKLLRQDTTEMRQLPENILEAVKRIVAMPRNPKDDRVGKNANENYTTKKGVVEVQHKKGGEFTPYTLEIPSHSHPHPEYIMKELKKQHNVSGVHDVRIPSVHHWK